MKAIPRYQLRLTSLLLVFSACGIAASVQVSIDIQENLYAGWTIISRPYQGWQAISNVKEQDPDVYPNASISSGNAFGREPATGAFSGQEPVIGFEGKRLINTKLRNLGTFTGELRSDVFEIKGGLIDFLIGGGRYQNRTCLKLFVKDNGEFHEVRSATGENNLHLIRKQWNVSEYLGREAYLDALDLAPIEPFMHSGPQNPDEQYGFLLLDDIRQLDATGRRVSVAYDVAHNFNFEQVKAPKYQVIPARPKLLGRDKSEQDFTIPGFGKFKAIVTTTALGPLLSRTDVSWSYTGAQIPGIKLTLSEDLPVMQGECQYYLFPGILYNGNHIGQAAHYLGEDFPEDAITTPGGVSVETKDRVYGASISPQKATDDPKASVRLEQSGSHDRYRIVFQLPDSVQFGHIMDTDIDQRFNVKDGFAVNKSFYFYAAKKEAYAPMSNVNQGYGQWVHAAWDMLYSQSPTNPQNSLTDDFALRLRGLLDPYALTEEVQMGQRTYRIWYVGRWTLPDDFDFDAHSFVPLEYVHRYTGFSWSGMLGRVSYTALEHSLETGDAISRQLATDTLDFFVENGASPLGILYQAYYNSGGFGTYASPGALDMGPLGEELYWYIRCYELLNKHGLAANEKWISAAKSSLDSLMKLYPDGNVPGRIDGTTGKASSRPIPLLDWTGNGTQPSQRNAEAHYDPPLNGGPTGFIYLIWAYTKYYSYSDDARYLHYAELLGNQLLGIMNSYGALAGAEMDFFNIDKRMPHAALAAFNDLYETTRQQKWLTAAIMAGNLFSTFQYSFNVNFDRFKNLPLGHFDYRTIGGTPVDVKFSTNNLAFAQGATEFIRLWRSTGDHMWFERARTLLHQGTESTLTEDKRQWLNANFQGPADGAQRSFNPKVQFDKHVLGGGTEDVLPAWPRLKGNWTTQHGAILSMYMFAEGFDWGEIKQDFGSLTYSFRYHSGGALDTLDQVSMTASTNQLSITARNMMPTAQTYSLRLLDYPGRQVEVEGRTYNRAQIEAGIPLTFSPHATRHIALRLASR